MVNEFKPSGDLQKIWHEYQYKCRFSMTKKVLISYYPTWSCKSATLYITCSLIYVNTHIKVVEKRGTHLTLGRIWQLPTLCRDSRCHLHNRERVRNQRTPQGRLSGVVFRETRWQGCSVVCGEDWRTRTNLFLSAAELVHPGLHECILVCVFWHLLHIEYQNLYSTSKVRTFLGSEGRLGWPSQL